MSYRGLLAQLNQPAGAVSFEALQSALAYHLARHDPLPTPVAAAAVSSRAFFGSLPALQSLFNAFRYSVHYKYQDARKSSEGLFSLSVPTRMRQWVNAASKGMQGGPAILRLAASGGLLAGLDDIQHVETPVEVYRSKVEDEVLLSFAETLDGNDQEEREVSLVILASCFSFVPETKLKMLPLASVSDVLSRALSGVFSSTATSPLHDHIASLSKLEAAILTAAIEARPVEGLDAAQKALDVLSSVTNSLMKGKRRTSGDGSEWNQLKTLFFCVLMLADASLSPAVYLPPASYSVPTSATPMTIASTTLAILQVLSPVIAQFGGLSVVSGEGLKEMYKAFYLSIDVLSHGKNGEAEDFMRGLLADKQLQNSAGEAVRDFLAFAELTCDSEDSEPYIAYTLACLEQLIPALDPALVQGTVVPVISPYVYYLESEAVSYLKTISRYLDGQSGSRQTLEGAHAAMVALLVEASKFSEEQRTFEAFEMEKWDSAKKLVPRYAECLIKHAQSPDGDKTLTVDQLCVTWRALIQCSAARPIGAKEDSTLALQCTTRLLSSGSPNSRVYHMVIASIRVLPRILEMEVMKDVMRDDGRELHAQLFAELLEVPYEDREWVMRWWSENRPLGVPLVAARL